MAHQRKAANNDHLTDLLIEFDEMGFCPTTVCPHPEQYAIEWKERLVNEIQKLKIVKEVQHGTSKKSGK